MKTILANVMIILVLAIMPAKAAIIYITPVQQQANIGDTLSIDVWIDGLAGDIVSGWDLDLLYDSTILQADDLVFELANFTYDPLFDALYDYSISATSINSFLVSFLLDDELAALQLEPVKLFSVNFTALTDGVSWLSFDDDPLFGLNVTGRRGESLVLDARGACVAVGQGECVRDVPAPATVWLFSGALLLFVGRRMSKLQS